MENKAPLVCTVEIEITFECEEVPSIKQIMQNITLSDFFKEHVMSVKALSGEFEEEL